MIRLDKNSVVEKIRRERKNGRVDQGVKFKKKGQEKKSA